jgi:hypothetical protein
MTDRPDCDAVEDLLAELATGAATGHDRALALGHVAGCVDCRRALAELSQIADGLLLLAPSVEPPAGFESAVLDSLRPARFRSRYRLVAAAAAVVLAAALGAGIVWWRTEPDRQLAAQHRQTLAVANGRYLKAARLTTEAGAPAGTIFLYQGSPSWLLVTIAGVNDGIYAIVAVDRDATPHAVGSCPVTNRSGTAGYRLDLPVSRVAEVQLRGTDGTRLVAHL